MAEGFNKEVSQAVECAIKYTKLARLLVRHISALEATKKTLLLPMRALASEIAARASVDVKISLEDAASRCAAQIAAL